VSVLDHARDPEVRSVALRALGLAARELHDVDRAIGELRRAVRAAQRAGLSMREAEARMSLCLTLAWNGDTAAALREADRAAPALRGLDAARLSMQRSLILQRLGRLDEALDGYKKALTIFRRYKDRLWEARLLVNRGVARAYRGELRAADSDLSTAEQLHEQLSQSLAAAQARWGRGFVAARAGDVPAALELYDSAIEDYRARSMSAGLILMDRCELLMSVRLTAEARRDAERAVADLVESGMEFDLAEARLMLAQAALLDGDADAAGAAAEAARISFERQRRAAWATLTRYVELKIAETRDSNGESILSAARRIAPRLHDQGWLVPAHDARIVAGRAALNLGRTAMARRELEVATRVGRRSPVEVKARTRHALALLRLQRGDRRGAYSALRAGTEALDRHRYSLGATELRVHVSGHGEELAALGLRMALEDQHAERVFAWAERFRAGALRQRPARPPDDARLAAELGELRAVVARIGEAAVEGRSAPSLVQRQAELEELIRARARRAKGFHTELSRSDPEAVAAALDDRALVEIVDCDGTLWAVIVVDGRFHLRALGPAADVERELDSVRFSLRRLALGKGSKRSLTVAADTAMHATKRLDELLIATIDDLVTDRSVVVVPTGALHAIPWSQLPSLVARPVTLAPSAHMWLEAMRRPAPHVDVQPVLVAGPDLPGAVEEVETLSGLYGSARVLTGDSARTADVLTALVDASFAHIACHGTFRADNPQFSSLRLADGPLTVFDLERLDAVPRLLVLSACDSGLSSVHAGNEIMGLAAALLALETRTIVATVIPIPDATATELMTGFHEELLKGKTASAALVAARSQLSDQVGYEALAAGAGFVCLGAD
jgi:tetratricopeptide (TPR) repeat protein